MWETRFVYDILTETWPYEPADDPDWDNYKPLSPTDFFLRIQDMVQGLEDPLVIRTMDELMVGGWSPMTETEKKKAKAKAEKEAAATAKKAIKSKQTAKATLQKIVETHPDLVDELLNSGEPL